MLRFALFGFPITVEPWFWLGAVLLGSNRIAGMLGLQILLLWIVAVFISILWHELGHAYLQRCFGGRHVEIRLHACGGYATANGDFTRFESRFIALAGPGAGLLLGVVAMAVRSWLMPDMQLVRIFVSDMVFINVFWSMVNLLPILPLDGGHVLEASLERPRVWFHRVGFVCALGAGLGLFIYFQQLYFLLLFGFLAYFNYKALLSLEPWSRTSWPDAIPKLRNHDRQPAKPNRRKQYQPKLRPQVELDETPAVMGINSLLDKISRDGIASLSDDERQTLERTSAALKERGRR